MDGSTIKREEAGASQMENPPTPQAEGEHPGAGDAQEPQPDSGNGSMDELKTPLIQEPIMCRKYHNKMEIVCGLQ